jgi:hypothetical protein
MSHEIDVVRDFSRNREVLLVNIFPQQDSLRVSLVRREILASRVYAVLYFYQGFRAVNILIDQIYLQL